MKHYSQNLGESISKYVIFLLDLVLTWSKIPYAKIEILLVRKHQLDTDRIRSLQRKIKSIRKIIFPISILAYLLNHLNDRYRYKHIVANTNEDYMKLFYFFSAITYARILRKNPKFIEDLISNKRPEQFPLEPKVRLNLKTNPYENDKLVGDYFGQKCSR